MSDQSKGIKAICVNGHEQVIYTPEMPREWAATLAGIMDGTSSIYVYPPEKSKEYPLYIGKCGICGSWFSCSVFGYLEPKGCMSKLGPNPPDYQALISGMNVNTSDRQMPDYKPEPEVTGTKSYDMKIDWVRLNAERMATLNPIKKLGAVAYLRKALASDMPKIRGAIAVNPQEWWAPFHMWWGMSVRNALRANGFSEKELGIDNLDDYYIGLVELAAGDSE